MRLYSIIQKCVHSKNLAEARLFQVNLIFHDSENHFLSNTEPKNIPHEITSKKNSVVS